MSTPENPKLIEETLLNLRRSRDRKRLEDEARGMLPDFHKRINRFVREHLSPVEMEDSNDNLHRGGNKLTADFPERGDDLHMEITFGDYPLDDSTENGFRVYRIQLNDLGHSLETQAEWASVISDSSQTRKAVPEDLQRFTSLFDNLDRRGEEVKYSGLAPRVLKSSPGSAPIPLAK